jgi:hypothetical protein
MSIWTLVRRNLGHNRTRTVLTTLAVAVSIFLVCVVLTLPSAREAMLASSANNLRLVVYHKAGFAYLLPVAYVGTVALVNGLMRGVAFELPWFSTAVVTLRISPFSLLVTLGIAVAIGIVGGLFPAHRAARLRVTEALRRA